MKECIKLHVHRTFREYQLKNNLHFQVRSVDVYRTVFELKTKLESMVKIPANRMRLFYVDQVRPGSVTC